MTRIEEFNAASKEYDLSTVRLHGYVKEWALHDVRDVDDICRLREQIAKADLAWSAYLKAAKGLNDPEPAAGAIGPEFGEPVF